MKKKKVKMVMVNSSTENLTYHHNSLNIKKNNYIWHWRPTFWARHKHKNVARLNRLMGSQPFICF